MEPWNGARGNGIRTGTSSMRGRSVGSPWTMRALKSARSAKCSTPASGHASAAAYSKKSTRRGRPDVFSAEPCTKRAWWMLMSPARAWTSRAPDTSSPSRATSMAPQNAPWLWWSYTGPLCEPGRTRSGPLSASMSSSRMPTANTS